MKGKLALSIVSVLFVLYTLCGTNVMAQTEQESQVVQALRVIHTAEMDYASAHLKKGYACKLAKLGPQISPGLASGNYAGYEFNVSCEGGTYRAIAVPTTGTGQVFCIDKSGVVRVSDDAKTCVSEGKVLNYKAKQISEKQGVPDADTAIAIARRAAIKIYGKSKIDYEEPLTASVEDGVWSVYGTLCCSDREGKRTCEVGQCVGGVVKVQIRQSDGSILSMSHTM